MAYVPCPLDPCGRSFCLTKPYPPPPTHRGASLVSCNPVVTLRQDIYVPDERSELVPWSLCLHNDSPSLAGRVDPSRLRCLHPRVSLEDCHRLRIPSVSQARLTEIKKMRPTTSRTVFACTLYPPFVVNDMKLAPGALSPRCNERTQRVAVTTSSSSFISACHRYYVKVPFSLSAQVYYSIGAPKQSHRNEFAIAVLSAQHPSISSKNTPTLFSTPRLSRKNCS